METVVADATLQNKNKEFEQFEELKRKGLLSHKFNSLKIINHSTHKSNSLANKYAIPIPVKEL